MLVIPSHDRVNVTVSRTLFYSWLGWRQQLWRVLSAWTYFKEVDVTFTFLPANWELITQIQQAKLAQFNLAPSVN